MTRNIEHKHTFSKSLSKLLPIETKLFKMNKDPFMSVFDTPSWTINSEVEIRVPSPQTTHHQLSGLLSPRPRDEAVSEMIVSCDLTVKLPPRASLVTGEIWRGELTSADSHTVVVTTLHTGWLIGRVDTETPEMTENIWEHERVMMLKFRPIYGNIEPGGGPTLLSITGLTG